MVGIGTNGALLRAG